MKAITSLLTLAAVFLGAGNAFAQSAEKVIMERTYGLKVRTVKCHEPVVPNGHNYPVYTALEINVSPFDLVLSGIFTSVERYRGEPNYQPCSTFKKLTNVPAGQYLHAKVTQKVTERTGKNINGVCLKSTREEATLVVEGVTFHGVNDMIVGPLAASECE
ncbi:MAG: hypothetical protein V4736_05300 [Bdellovibrionota bacterium]